MAASAKKKGRSLRRETKEEEKKYKYSIHATDIQRSVTGHNSFTKKRRSLRRETKGGKKYKYSIHATDAA